MNTKLLQEFETIQVLFKSVNKNFPASEGVQPEEIDKVYRVTGIQLFGDIIDFYRLLNGSNREEIFAVFTDEDTPCQFLSISSALDFWGSEVADVDLHYQKVNESYSQYEQFPPRDVRIQPNIWVNRNWFPFAEFNGGGTIIYWDNDPTPQGIIGQIIVYQHDPDAIYYVAEDFLSFFRKSNKLFAENPRELLEAIYD